MEENQIQNQDITIGSMTDPVPEIPESDPLVESFLANVQPSFWD